MSTIAIIQARMGSSRLPGKVLLDIAGATLLERTAQRAARIPGVDQVVIATTDVALDDAIGGFCRERDWPCFRGSEPDVLDRYTRAARAFGAELVIRVTSDCPFLCVSEAGRLLAFHKERDADYSHNITVWGSGMPLGTGVEVFTRAALEASWSDGREPHHREHVDEYIYEHPERFRIEMITAPPELHRPEMRLTVDTEADLELVREIYRRLGEPGQGDVVALRDVIALLDAEPALLELNRDVVQKRY